MIDRLMDALLNVLLVALVVIMLGIVVGVPVALIYSGLPVSRESCLDRCEGYAGIYFRDRDSNGRGYCECVGHAGVTELFTPEQQQ